MSNGDIRVGESIGTAILFRFGVLAVPGAAHSGAGRRQPTRRGHGHRAHLPADSEIHNAAI
ncbi:hypothetical protein [Streptomyces griseus]|uniref:hypothetical protein n=1 Tax=Streptomyces griseus TaxID=1911 RepID=UPI00131E75AB|nr:hypothetical protein [Streptomyces griseus]